MRNILRSKMINRWWFCFCASTTLGVIKSEKELQECYFSLHDYHLCQRLQALSGINNECLAGKYCFHKLCSLLYEGIKAEWKIASICQQFSMESWRITWEYCIKLVFWQQDEEIKKASKGIGAELIKWEISVTMSNSVAKIR